MNNMKPWIINWAMNQNKTPAPVEENNAKINTTFTGTNRTVLKNIVELPTLDLSGITSGQLSISGMPLLKKVSIINADGLSQMNQMFYNDTALEKVSIDSLNNSVYNMCSQCSNLKSFSGVTKTKNLTDISTMFQYCSKLESVPFFDTSKVQYASGAFSSCLVLKSLPPFDFSNVENFGSMCFGCSSLINVPLFNAGKANRLNNMFSNCPNLSDESLNNIMAMCITTTSAYTESKTLSNIGLDSKQRNRCQTLSNYQAFLDAGWNAS